MADQAYGYILAPARRSSEPGAAKLQIFLEAKPSSEHFDPKSVLISVLDERGGVTPISIEHPWASGRELRVCAGPFDLIDRKDKHVEGFTYGGELHIEVGETTTKLTLESPAPILVRPNHALANLLAEESEILLAKRRATVNDEEVVEQHLAEAEPLQLYKACLDELEERQQRLPPGDDALMMKFKHMVKEERRAVEDLLPGSNDLDLNELI
jgi:hypothetical protein